MPYTSWDALRGADIAPQTLDFSGGTLKMTSDGDTISIAAGSILNMMQFVLDCAVSNEDRQPRPDKYARQRSALGASSGVTFTGYTCALTLARGIVLTETASGFTFDVGNASSFCGTLASLCQTEPTVKTAAGLLQRT